MEGTMEGSCPEKAVWETQIFTLCKSILPQQKTLSARYDRTDRQLWLPAPDRASQHSGTEWEGLLSLTVMELLMEGKSVFLEDVILEGGPQSHWMVSHPEACMDSTNKQQDKIWGTAGKSGRN